MLSSTVFVFTCYGTFLSPQRSAKKNVYSHLMKQSHAHAVLVVLRVLMFPSTNQWSGRLFGWISGDATSPGGTGCRLFTGHITLPHLRCITLATFSHEFHYFTAQKIQPRSVWSYWQSGEEREHVPSPVWRLEMLHRYASWQQRPCTDTQAHVNTATPGWD